VNWSDIGEPIDTCGLCKAHASSGDLSASACGRAVADYSVPTGCPELHIVRSLQLGDFEIPTYGFGPWVAPSGRQPKEDSNVWQLIDWFQCGPCLPLKTRSRTKAPTLSQLPRLLIQQVQMRLCFLLRTYRRPPFPSTRSYVDICNNAVP